MSRSVLGRLTITHLLVALASVALVTGLSSYLFSSFYLSQRRAELVVATERLAVASERLLRAGETQAATQLAMTIGEAFGGRACVFDREKLRLAQAGQLSTLDPHDALLQSCLGDDLGAIATGMTHVQCQGLVHRVTAPVRDGTDGPLLGVVMLNCPVAGIERILAAQRSSSILAAAGAALLALLLGAVASRGVSRPLREISAAAERLARGDFDVHVQPRGPTEISMLARTTNWSARSLKQAFAELSTEREKLSDVLVSMSDGVLAYDRDGTIALANARARELLGLPQGPLEGRRLADLVAEGGLLEALRAGTGEEPIEVEGRLLRIQTASLSGGGASAVIVDVSQTARLDRMRRDFVANASHQLRAPLTSIRGFLEAVADGTANTPECKARCVAVALEQVMMLQRLVNELLELSRLQSGTAMDERKPLSLVELAQHACAHLEPQASAKGVTLALKRGEGPAWILADGDRLLQATHNLLDNAIRYSPPGETVVVSVRQGRAGVELSVADRGRGLAPGEADAVWERFYSGRKDGGAAGLGLAITREIVRGHEGSVFARPNDGTGAVFGYVLPALERPLD